MDNQLKATDLQQTELYNRIRAFALDQPHSQLSFSRQLAKANFWSLTYTQRVIEEYKKFTFLAVVAGHPVAPSDQVDQAWHLHLSYTRSYWQEFCPEVLQMPLHHDPSQGGRLEQLKLDDWYRKTLTSYEKFFGRLPPTDIWPDPITRFGQDLHFIRVNKQRNWLIPKLSLPFNLPFKKQPLVLLLLFCLPLLVTGCQSTPNPLNFTGPEFLTFYFWLIGIFVIMAYCYRRYLHLPPKTTPSTISLTPYEAAYLAGGKERVVDTAIALLVQKQYVTVELEERTLRLQESLENILDPTECAVAEAIEANGEIRTVRASQTFANIHNQLSNLGLLVSPEQGRKVRILPICLFIPLLGLGILKILIGLSRGKPVSNLFFMCFVVVLIIVVFASIPIFRSRYGDWFLQELHAQVPSRSVDSTSSQVALAVALWGISILYADEVFAGLTEIIRPVSSVSESGDSSSWGGDSGGGDSGGGDGGGGCGGCGGE